MKTKKIILFLFAMIFACGQMWAQDDLPYRPFKAFNNDTIRYLDYNFTLRGDQYVDKTVGDLIRNLELPLIYVKHIVMEIPTFEIQGMNLVIRAIENDGDYRKDYYIGFALKSGVNNQDFYNALRVDERNKEQKSFYYWTPQLYELIKDCKIRGTIANDWLFPDRRKLLESDMDGFDKVKKIKEVEKTNWRNIIRAEKQAEIQKKQD